MFCATISPDFIRMKLSVSYLCLVSIVRFRNRLQATAEEALAVLLIRLSYLTRYWAMMDQFGHSRTWLSIIFNDTLIHLYQRYRKKLAWDEKRLTFAQLSIYSQAIHNLGGGSCFSGFIDGTLNATCRPVLDQEQFYSGHKRKHGYKYQAITTPDGLVSSLMGSFIGRHGDWKMVEQSGLEEKQRAVNGGRRPAHGLYLYGDPAYCTVYGIMGPYKNYPTRPRTPAQYQFNRSCHGYGLRWNMGLLLIRTYGPGMAFIWGLKFIKGPQFAMQ